MGCPMISSKERLFIKRLDKKREQEVRSTVRSILVDAGYGERSLISWLAGFFGALGVILALMIADLFMNIADGWVGAA